MFKFIKKKKINSEIMRCIEEGCNEVILKNLNFEAARSYAVDHGTKSFIDPFTKEPNMYYLNIEKKINGINYEINFKRIENDGTRIVVLSPEQAKEKNKIMGDKMKDGSYFRDLLDS